MVARSQAFKWMEGGKENMRKGGEQEMGKWKEE